MSNATTEPKPTKSLRDADLKATLQHLRQTDNLTNWYYLARTYLYFVLVLGSTLYFFAHRESWELSWAWNVPVAILAVILVGAGQHQLSALAHEGVHHILFRGRYLNDLACDFLAMFPLFSNTYHYRLQHLAHHQFVNDLDRDPDISQMKTSGHWLDFPVSKKTFLRTLLKQLFLPNLIRFMRIRAKYNAMGTDKNPYMKKGKPLSKVAVKVGLLYILAMIGTLTGLYYVGDPVLLAIVPAVLWIGMIVAFAKLPDDKFHQSRVHPVISMRMVSIYRLTYITAIFVTLAWLTVWTGEWAAGYFLLLWILPLFTSFAFFMILRQWVQHGNGDRGWLTNTRVFFVSPFIRFAVFPMGQDLHLPHHLYASIPHYRLRKLHDALMEYPEYREEAVVVEGYFAPRYVGQKNPTVLDVLGPQYSLHTDEVYIDHSVMDDGDFEEKEEIMAQGKA